ncbi:MAG TPA: type II toxin-antitoxin system RelE/ParE family toxin [Gammaproteobacteria bacterium]|nr:type II toxin-antitoxin system RelE/ParE family toxin [Gammaproteobacteria bacterium]
MSPRRLVIAPAAKHDLGEIYQYGGRHWGKSRSQAYLSRIKKQLWLLTRQPHLGVERPELLPDVRSFPLESHTLYYRVTPTSVEIIRVLHGRQDPRRHL